MGYTVTQDGEGGAKARHGPKRIHYICIGTTVMTLLCLCFVLVTHLITQKHPVEVTLVESDAEESSANVISPSSTTTTTTTTTTPKSTATRPVNTSADTSAIVELDCLTIQGTASDGAFVFKGIPYAQPPVGAFRWKPPVPFKAGIVGKCDDSDDNVVIDASQFGEKCFQASYQEGVLYEGSENCLFLNVWTPTLNSSAGLPVTVYVHGGSLVSLDGNTPTYSPNPSTAVSGNMVFVSMNYRLGVLGFLALDILSEVSSTNTSGNYGLMDQILALEWVKANIEKFGGNPNLVTLAGHSSGATSVFALLASPAADGLYHRAWLSSGSVSLNKTLAEASAANLAFLNNTGCQDVDCLYQLTAEQLMRAIPIERWIADNLNELPMKGIFNDPLAIADGVVVPFPPLQAWEENLLRITVPVLVGTTAQEVDFFAMPQGIKSWNWTVYEEAVRMRLGTFGANISREALQLYPTSNEYDPEYQYTSMVSDVRATCPTRTLADVMASVSSANVYRYVVTSQPSKEVSYLALTSKPAYAYHTLDLFAFFGVLEDYIQPLTAAERDFQSTVQSEVFHFIRTGRVKSSNWRAFPNSTAIVDSNVTVVNDYHETQCDFWESNGFLQYAWTN